MRLTSPGPTVGVVGGGQLGRMLGEAAGPLGVEVVVSDPTPDPPAASVVRDAIVGEFDDHSTLRELAERADVLTVEIELADPAVLERVSEETGTPVHPAPETIRMTQDKLLEKETLAEAGIPVPEFRRVDDVEDLHSAGEDLGWPVMCKARTGGYDGRGNRPVDRPDRPDRPDRCRGGYGEGNGDGDDRANGNAVAAGRVLDELGGPALAEEMVEFERELAVIGVRGESDTTVFPVTETVHEAEILRETLSPARIDPETRLLAREVATNVIEVLDGRGVFGIELFEVSDGSVPNEVDSQHGANSDILVNEIAPRPHNSGHWTIEGCPTSQFAQHVRAVLGWPLGRTTRRFPAVTANVLGDVSAVRQATLAGIETVLADAHAALHWYGKREVRALRKMGHLTLVDETAEDCEELLPRARSLRDSLTFE